ncbi:MAG TPA: hypothetical protein VE971_01870 [Candidatus Eisenbacteria bacterium]|nr:hypothetical protein [Candidatus Eisenbacteria bacterium]
MMKITNLDNLAMLFCTLVIVSTIGSSFAIRNSFAQAQQIQQTPTITYKSPWNDNMPISSVGSSQPLCAAGVCNKPSNPASTMQISNADPTTQLSSQDPSKLTATVKNTFTNSKNLSVNHAFVSSRIVGPDRFRFVTSYWTTTQVSRLIDAGRSAGNITSQFPSASFAAPSINSIGPVIIPRSTFAGAQLALPPSSNQLPLSNLQIEVDKGEGYSTLAVVLQYEGVVSLAGITAALKLPTGFKAQYPLTDDRHDFDIALANYDGGIRPSQEVVLYFPLYILTTAKVQLPVLGPLALHFLRNAPRSVEDSLGTAEQNMFAKALSITNGTNSTMFNNSLGFNRNYIDKSSRFIPYDFINQVIPVIFKATGREVYDVYQSPQSLTTINAGPPQKYGQPFAIELTFANHGDVPLYNLVVQLGTVLPVGTGNSFIVAPQLPIVIRGQSTYYIPIIGPGQEQTRTVYISSLLYCNTNQALEVDSSYNNIIGVRAQQSQVVGVSTTGPLLWPLAPGSATAGVVPPNRPTTVLPPTGVVPQPAAGAPPLLPPTLRTPSK